MDNQQILQKYVGDMHALESHIFQAIDKQLKLAENDPQAKTKFQQFSSTLQSHLDSLQSRLEALGGSATHPIKEAGAAALGVAAGLIDKVRAEEISKDLRDDYTALNLSIISYVMLNATALALGDRETASLAERNVKDNADFVIWINNNIGRFVLKDLQDSGATIAQNASSENQAMVKRVWGESKHDSASQSSSTQSYAH
jgi:ferritin-like metal-binding protein YciE